MSDELPEHLRAWAELGKKHAHLWIALPANVRSNVAAQLIHEASTSIPRTELLRQDMIEMGLPRRAALYGDAVRALEVARGFLGDLCHQADLEADDPDPRRRPYERPTVQQTTIEETLQLARETPGLGETAEEIERKIEWLRTMLLERAAAVRADFGQDNTPPGVKPCERCGELQCLCAPCPRCSEPVPDLDGFGVIAHLSGYVCTRCHVYTSLLGSGSFDTPCPSCRSTEHVKLETGCGYCAHPSKDGDKRGGWICGICDQRFPGPLDQMLADWDLVRGCSRIVVGPSEACPKWSATIEVRHVAPRYKDEPVKFVTDWKAAFEGATPDELAEHLRVALEGYRAGCKHEAGEDGDCKRCGRVAIPF